MTKIIKYNPRKISDGRMRNEIIRYLRKHPNTDAYDVAIALNLDPGKVLILVES